MAVTKTILKKAKHEVVVKFANDTGSNQTSTFDLDVDALLSTEVIEGTVKVNIVEIHWAGQASSHFHIERNSVKIFGATGSDADQFIFSGFFFNKSIAAGFAFLDKLFQSILLVIGESS